MNALFWLLAVAANAGLLLVLTRRLDGAVVIKRAVIALVATPVVFTAIALICRATGAQTSRQFFAYFLAVFFTLVIMSVINIANVFFRGAVDALADFHERNNAANIHRFPISVLVRHRDRLKVFASVVWCLGSALMLYGVWFDTAVVK